MYIQRGFLYRAKLRNKGATHLVGTVGLSAETRRTSKKPDLCGLQPVAGDAEMEAKT